MLSRVPTIFWSWLSISRNCYLKVKALVLSGEGGPSHLGGPTSPGVVARGKESPCRDQTGLSSPLSLGILGQTFQMDVFSPHVDVACSPPNSPHPTQPFVSSWLGTHWLFSHRRHLLSFFTHKEMHFPSHAVTVSFLKSSGGTGCLRSTPVLSQTCIKLKQS